jgi:hypothetical protein
MKTEEFEYFDKDAGSIVLISWADFLNAADKLEELQLNRMILHPEVLVNTYIVKEIEEDGKPVYSLQDAQSGEEISFILFDELGNWTGIECPPESEDSELLNGCADVNDSEIISISEDGTVEVGKRLPQKPYRDWIKVNRYRNKNEV